MNMLNIVTHSKPSNSNHQDRRMLTDRRIHAGRRSMVRFDATGGDRRSGFARRSTDIGFREQSDEA